MFSSLPDNVFEFMEWSWPRIEPYYQDLRDRPIDGASVSGWLSDWSQLTALLKERYERLFVATTMDTTDEVAEKRFNAFLDEINRTSECIYQGIKSGGGNVVELKINSAS